MNHEKIKGVSVRDDFLWLHETVAEHEIAHAVAATALNVGVRAIECYKDKHGWGYGRCIMDTVSLLLTPHESQQVIAVAGCVRIATLYPGYTVESFFTDENYGTDVGGMGDRALFHRAWGTKESFPVVVKRAREVLSTPWATECFRELVPMLMNRGVIHIHDTVLSKPMGG